MWPLEGKNIVVTGASRGLGYHIAQGLWNSGANLLLVARSEEALVDLQMELAVRARPTQQSVIAVEDLTRPGAIDAVVNKARSVWEKLHGLVNNAGVVGAIGPVWENDWDDWQHTISINFFVPVALCRACVPWMIEGGGGKIINLSGGGATGPRPNFSAYATAKTGIVRFSEILAQEVHDMNIQVNSIAPGALNTDMLEAVLMAGPERAGKAEYDDAVKQKADGGASPQGAADLCAFLCSAASDGISGKLISAVWDPWKELPGHVSDLAGEDIYTLRRIVPHDRGKDWG